MSIYEEFKYRPVPFKPEEQYRDSVEKIRVSNPETLIDTDFEFGLQSTKWETLERVNHIPTAFAREGATPLSVSSITAVNDSDTVTVTTSIEHTLGRGSPVIIQGLIAAGAAAEGTYVVTKVSNTTVFEFKAKRVLPITGELSTPFTRIVPGAFYQGSSYNLDDIVTITTDSAANSTIYADVGRPHGHVSNASFIIVNTINTRNLPFLAEAYNANTDEGIEANNLITSTQSGIVANAVANAIVHIGNRAHIPYEYDFSDAKYFDAANVTLANEYIELDHDWANNIGVMLIGPPDVATPLTGLTTLNAIYYWHVVNSTTGFIKTTPTGTTPVNITAIAANSHGSLGLVPVWRAQSVNLTTDVITINATGIPAYSNLDLLPFPAATDLVVELSTSSGINAGAGGVGMRTTSLTTPTLINYHVPNTADPATRTLKLTNEAGTVRNIVNNTITGVAWFAKVLKRNDNNSFLVPSHGFTNNDIVRISFTGTLPTVVAPFAFTNNSYYAVETVDSNKFRLKTNNSVTMLTTTVGNANFTFVAFRYNSLADKINVPNHGLSQGTELIYSANGGTAVGGLTGGSTYYVYQPTTNSFFLSTTSAANTGSLVLLSAVTAGATQTFSINNAVTIANQDAVRISSTGNIPLGLSADEIYYVRVPGVNGCTLHYTKADVIANANKVPFLDAGSGSITLEKLNVVEISDVSNTGGYHDFAINEIGVFDGNFLVSNVVGNTLQFALTSKVNSSTFAFDPSFAVDQYGDQIQLTNHRLVTGTSVVYDEGGGTALAGLSNGSTYYVVRRGKNWISLAATREDALANTIIDLTDIGAGSSHQFTCNTVAGEVIGTGNVSFVNTDNIITGFQTNFLSTYKDGDKISVLVADADTALHAARTCNTTNIILASDFIVTANGAFANIVNGQPVYITISAGGTTPGGLVNNQIYYASTNGAGGGIKLYSNVSLAAANGAGQTDITSVGSGSYQLWKLHPGIMYESNIVHVSNATVLTLSSNLAVPTYYSPNTGVEYGVRTSMLVRGDGAALHRPYDGGIELVPSLVPDGELTRQTRRYFRYQSGKGLQCSVAVNFNAPTTIENYNIETYSFNNFTITNGGSGYSNGELIKLVTPPTTAKVNMAASIVTNSSGGITNILISNTGVGYPAANNGVNTNIYIVTSDGSANSSGTGADITGNMVLNSIKVQTGVAHRVTDDLKIRIFDAEVDSGTNYWNFDTSVTKVASGEDRDTVFYTNIIGDGISVANVIIFDGGTGFSNGDKLVFSNSGSNTSTVFPNATITTDGSGVITTVTLSNTGSGFYEIPTFSIGNSSGGITTGAGANLAIEPAYSNAIPGSFSPNGFPQFYVKQWNNSRLRAGLFDDQNGMFFEYDGTNIYAVKRSSTKQLTGTANAVYRSALVTGNGTRFTQQIANGEYIVMRGQTYKVVSVVNDTQLFIQPYFRGANTNLFKMAKTIDTKIPQSQWNLDKADGTGASGLTFDVNKIQMCYIDYAWYGAGNIRYGFKDINGSIFYVHQILHSNRETKAYIRSGNLPARYELKNIAQPDYVPALLHWGTSVIMDGRFDDDKAYLFTASGDLLSFTGSGTATFLGNIFTTQRISSNNVLRNNLPVDYHQYYYIMSNTTAAVANVKPGTAVSNTTYLRANTVIPLTPITDPVTTTRAIVPLTLQPITTATNNAAPVTFTIGSANASLIVERNIPLVSVRLAPSVDNGAGAALGVRDIVNRMQLVMKSIGVLTTHDSEVTLILNGSLNNYNWTRLENTPSLSQLIKHSITDSVIGGTPVFSFRVSGGTVVSSKRISNFTVQDLEDLFTLGNSIQGGDQSYPDGPDVLTIAIRFLDYTDINVTSPLLVSARVTWTESQA